MLKRALFGSLSLLAVLAMVLLGNTYRKTTQQIDVQPVTHVKVDTVRAAERLAGAVRFRTITYDNKPDAAAAEFEKLHAYIEASFPLIHRTLKREVVAGYSRSTAGKEPIRTPRASC